MKKTTTTPFWRLLPAIGFLWAAIPTSAQVIVGLNQRTSQYTPERKIYNIKGDFALIGNTNLTLQNYGNQVQNGNNPMKYVDVDAPDAMGLGGTPTFNASSARLEFADENGSNPECSRVVYAGLYWSGRASDAAPDGQQFSVEKQVLVGNQAFSTDYPTLSHSQTMTHAVHTLSVSHAGTITNSFPRYTFSGSGNLYQFNFTNAAANMVSVSVNGGAPVNLPATVTVNGFVKTAVLSTPYLFTSGTAQVKIISLTRDSRTNLDPVQTQSASKVFANASGVAPVYEQLTKNFDKQKIMFRGPGASTYTEFTAHANDLYYPVDGAHDFMYSAYAEVTDYVREHGLGDYFAADIATREGNGGPTGYYGGWGLIVVYENDLMRYRDVTLFDGHAYVFGGTAQYDLPVSGFNTVQSGPVGMKIGLLAGEGDRDITGDYFQIQRQNDGQFIDLVHSGNTASNFFNASIPQSVERNPSLLNNTGIDLSVFELPNENNNVIGNAQTSTTFRYGSTQDTYVIFAVAMAVDAYIPELEGLLALEFIGGAVAAEPFETTPGTQMGFSVEVRNRGTEPVENARLVIPLPYNTDYISASQQILFTPLPSPNTVTFDPTLGANGSIIWEIGSLPLPDHPDDLLGVLQFSLSATVDCDLLLTFCQNRIVVDGTLSGLGAITGVPVQHQGLILGRETDGLCESSTIPAPLVIGLDAAEYVAEFCDAETLPLSFTFCGTDPIPVASIQGNFPAGTIFLSHYPIDENTIQYTINQPFPATQGATTYFALPPGVTEGCEHAFTIVVNIIDTLPVTAPVTYCLGADAEPLSATASGDGNTLFYFETPTAAPQLSLTPAISQPGTYTFYVAEGLSSDCLSELVPIVVTVLPEVTWSIPANLTLTGCNLDDVTNLPFSSALAQISAAQFVEAGGTLNIDLNSSPEIFYSDVLISESCPLTFTRTFYLETPCQQLEDAQQITVEDTTPPSLSPLPDPVEITACTEVPEFETPTVADGCSEVTLSFTDEITTDGCTTTTVRTWTATDACGNAATTTQSISVVSPGTPVFEPLGALELMACGTTPEFGTPVALDACGSALELTFSDETLPGDCEGSYAIVRTWTATSACGTSAQISQTAEFTDSIAPEITLAAQDLVLFCPDSEAIGSWLQGHGGAMATDCTSVIWTHDFESAPETCGASVTVTFTATDACGNTAITSAQLTISDTEAPVIGDLPEIATIACTTDPQFLTPEVTDNCSGDILLTFTDEEITGDCAGQYQIVRTWLATDACGNTSTKSQTLQYEDTMAPTFVQTHENLVLNCDAPAADEIAAWLQNNAGAVASDVCSEVVWSHNYDGALPPCNAPVVVTFTATDACGNAASFVANISRGATGSLSFNQTLPADLTVTCGDIPEAPVLTATQNCSQSVFTAVLEETNEAGSCQGDAIITRTWTAMDECGNTVEHIQLITVTDDAPPVLIWAPEAEIWVSCAEIPTAESPVFADDCSELGPMTFTETQSDITDGSYTITRVWTVADNCGNSAGFTQQIHITTAAPTMASAYVACNTDESLILDLSELLPFGTPANGSFIDVDETNQLQGSLFSGYELATGDYIIDYIYENNGCTQSVRFAVEVDDDCAVLPACTVTVHNAFSPNGDGVNEVFYIENFENSDCIVDNRVEIYNRWGVLVFEMNQYNNTTRAFTGHSQARATVGSEPLPAGTYFYLIQYTTADGQNVKRDGYVYLTR